MVTVDNAAYKIAAFYAFFPLSDPDEWAQAMRQKGQGMGNLLGTMIVAPEGINATLAGRDGVLDAFIDCLREDPRLSGMDVKYAYSESPPFGHFRVKRKAEIVTFRQAEAEPCRQVGTYVEPEDWNALIERDDVTLLDTRNDYEVELGTFPGALNPHTDNFTAFAEYVQANLERLRQGPVAMYCTGGIRCEKASSYLLSQNLGPVYHLRGGILNYLEKTPPQDQLWEGECFVFDHRVAVDGNLKPTRKWRMDPATGRPLAMDENG